MTSERFAALAEKYMDTIYRLAYSCTRSAADADDVTQEVLIHLYREEMDFQSDEHVKNWLMKVTINQCRMLFRSPWRKAEPIDDYAETLQMENEDQVACGGINGEHDAENGSVHLVRNLPDNVNIHEVIAISIFGETYCFDEADGK